LTKQNLPMISEMVDACVLLGADVIQFLRFMPLEVLETSRPLTRRSNGLECGPTTIGERDAARFFGKLEELRVRYPSVYLSAGGSLGFQFRKKEKQVSCPAGKTQFVIGLDNGIYPCIYLTQRENRLGEFIDGELEIEREFALDATGAGVKPNPFECPAYAYLKKE
ncbi:TPA: hypothetical protein HA238_03785, partial [Candidatus Micrarchaeota archaeon]|nr:hypothetical protein [Candidatus Micrarchaeota archaeon]